MHFIVTYSGDLRLGNVAPPRHLIQAELSLIVNVSCRNFPSMSWRFTQSPMLFIPKQLYGIGCKCCRTI
jgi:hypothetical protein